LIPLIVSSGPSASSDVLAARRAAPSEPVTPAPPASVTLIQYDDVEPVREIRQLIKLHVCMVIREVG
jgi:hypothetical protein